MISKNTIKLIKSLSQKKYRKKENLFLVEGDKNVAEVLDSHYKVLKLFATNEFYKKNIQLCQNAQSFFEADPVDIKKASLLKTPQNCLAICEIPAKQEFPTSLNNNLSIYLDDIQDPGNLGTIIRICDWFKVEHLFCSPNSADLYNPKVIQASMGSFCRVNIWNTNFNAVEKLAKDSSAPVLGAFLGGSNIYKEKLPQKVILVMGNEGNGIQPGIEEKVTGKIMIPNFSKNSKGAESLNVSVATAIICSEFKRNSFN